MVDPVRGGRYEDGGGKGADVRNWSPDGVEVSEARNEEEAEERTMDSLRSGAN